MRAHASEVASRAHAPYSSRCESAVILLSDGSCVPGVRVESASFSLTIPAIMNAVAAAVSLGRSDVVALVQSRAFLPEEHAYLLGSPFDGLVRTAPDAYAAPEFELPAPTGILDPSVAVGATSRAEEGIRKARTAATKAYVPESGFPVGCVIETSTGAFVPGVNVENRDWTRVLCAERTALGSVMSYDLGSVKAVYLSCLKDPAGTPCGACRQLLSELAPQSTLWMDRGEGAPESSDPMRLLPGSFTGWSIKRTSH